MEQSKKIKNVIRHSRENGNLVKTPVCHKAEPSEAGSPHSRGWQTSPVLCHGGSLPPQSRGINGKCFGFTLIELLVSISILATISIVGYVSYAAHVKTSYNATRIETIDSLHLSLSDYYQLKKTLPDPNSNYVSYDERGTYMHSLSGAYGVSGHASNDFLPAGYVNFKATDPESNQFYGYGKLTDNTSFDLAAALYDDVTGGYKTYLRGTYPKQRLASLVRAYSSSNFVSQDSTEDLPYNPYERKVTARVSSSSGTVSIANDKWIPLSLTGELNSGDSVTVATGSTALLHISDGSELSLWSTGSQTVLALSTLAYGDDNNLASKVALWLKSGEVWTEAPHFRTEADSKSDFSIHTDTAVAAVRGTVFGVAESITGATSISLASGRLEVAQITTDANGNILSQQSFSGSNGFNTTTTGWFVLDNSGSYMVVPDGGQPITLYNITNTPTSPTSTGSVDPSQIEKKLNHPPFSFGYRPKADRISFSGTTTSTPIGTPSTASVTTSQTGILSVIFRNYKADSYYLSFGTGKIDPNQPFPVPNPNPVLTGTLASTGTITITGAFAYIPDPKVSRTYTLRVCFHGHCSAPDIKVLGGDEFSFDNFRVWGEQNKAIGASSRSWTPPPTSCPTDPAQTGFWSSDCLTGPNSGLVAYAPYDSFNQGWFPDIENFFKQSFWWYSKDGTNLVTFDTHQVMAWPERWKPIYDGTTWFFWTSSATTAFNYPNSQFNDHSHIIKRDDWVEWVFIDNVWNDSYLKYNLAPLGLTGSFAIEMSVRGGALKRPSCGLSCRYHLFEFKNATNSWVYLTLYSGSLIVGSHAWWSWGSYSDVLKIDNFGSLDNNSFYKVIVTFNNNSWNLRIKWDWIDIVWYSIWTPFAVSMGSTGEMSVWSRKYSSAYDSEWNDIIDSVKIFKN